MNYNDHQGDHQDDHQSEDMSAIRKMIIENNKVTVKDILARFNISPETVRRRIKNMQDVKFVGSGYSGHWEIKE